MKVYYRGRSSNHHLYVQPANEYPHVSEWREPDGRPKSFDIHFKNGEADVDDKLADYLVDKNLASKTKVIGSLSEVA